jgi:catalase
MNRTCLAAPRSFPCAAVAAVLAMLPVPVSGQTADRGTVALPRQLPSQLVQDLHGAFGNHRARAVHTKGIILQGSFVPSADARTLSKAVVFNGKVPVVVRFSDFTGLPDIPDTSGSASPRGFAVKFLMPDGSNLDIVSHSFNGFPVATSADFSALLQALGRSGPEAGKPTELDAFLSAHPVAKSFFATQKPPPESFATAQYYGVNAFLFTDPAGRSRPVRYRFVPEAGERYLDETALRSRSPTYLVEEIVSRVTKGSVRFTWVAQLGEPGDKIDDPSVAWPETRRLVPLGLITVDKAGPNTAEADRGLLFLPGTLLPGIEIADPMVTVRNAAYPVSFQQRQ